VKVTGWPALPGLGVTLSEVDVAAAVAIVIDPFDPGFCELAGL
jgi:hypothetical protein